MGQLNITLSVLLAWTYLANGDPRTFN